MTNPLEQIRSAIDKDSVSVYERLAEVRGILDASQGYVCVPVEQLERWRLDLSQGDMRPRWEIEEFVESSKETNHG